MDTLQVLWRTLPMELQEIIQRFTYKTQNAQLLMEIKKFQVAKQNLCGLTELIDTANTSDGFQETSESIHQRLFPGLDALRTDPNRKALLKTWKYKHSFQGADDYHRHEEKQFTLMPWEQSYAVSFWMGIYH